MPRNLEKHIEEHKILGVSAGGGSGGGDVTGPGSSTLNAPAVFASTTGKVLKNPDTAIDFVGQAITNVGLVDGRNVSTDGAAQDSHFADATIHFTETSISHLNIADIGTNSHAAIDTHIADATLHFTEASIDHVNILNIGSNTHTQIDIHIADTTIHFTEASIDHTAILNIGTNTHAQIDSHMASSVIHGPPGPDT